MFSTPPDAELYIELILQRCRDLIESTIWQDLHVQRLNSWFGNFLSKEDKYFAARVLDNLIYRPRLQTLALIDYLFVRSLPEAANRLSGSAATIDDWITPFGRHTAHESVRFIPVIRSIDPPTKSGPLVARMVKRHLQIDDSNFVWPDQIENALEHGASVFVFLDDFVGTGDQFIKFFRTNNFDTYANDATFIYAPFVAHAEGVKSIRAFNPRILVTFAELLDGRQQLFSDCCDCFNDEQNSRVDALAHYHELIEKIGLKSSLAERVWLGYGQLALAFSFSHASPNNSLPLLWWRGPNFVPLFDR